MGSLIKPGTARRLGLRLPPRPRILSGVDPAVVFGDPHVVVVTRRDGQRLWIRPDLMTPRARFILDHYPHLLTKADLRPDDGVQIGRV